MNRFLSALAFVSFFALAACTGAVGQQAGQTAGPNNDMPKGYGVINQEQAGLRPVLKPGRLMTAPADVVDPELLTADLPAPVVTQAATGGGADPVVWTKLDDYDKTVTFVSRQPEPLRNVPAPQPASDTSGGSVVVFPLEGDVASLGYTEPLSSLPYAPSDDLPLSIVSSSGVQLVSRGDSDFNYYPLNGELASAIYFSHGSAALSREDRNRLADMAKGIGQGGIIHVTGHASPRVEGVNDPVLRRIINLKMSMKRAEAVSAQLLRTGIAPERVETLGMGDTRPNANPGKRGQDAADRRVEIYLGR